MNVRRLCIYALILLAMDSPAYAQVFLEEGKVKLSVSPGENVAGKLLLHNTADKNVDVKVYWEDFVYKPPFDGSKDFVPRGTTDHSSADWVNVSSTTLAFGPFAKRAVSYSINVPNDMSRGHYGVLFFENLEDRVDARTGLNIVTRVGCLFFIEPKNKIKTVNLSNFQFSGSELKAEFTNQGNVILIPDGTFYVINQEGMVFDRGQIDKIYLPPGKTADYKLMLDRDLASGDYTLVMTIALEDDDVIVKEIDFRKNYPSGFNIVEIRD